MKLLTGLLFSTILGLTPALAAEGTLSVTAGSGTNTATTAADGAGNVSTIGSICGGASGTMGTACNSQASVNGGALSTSASQSGTWNITNVSGTVSLPTGAATAANQTTANTALAAIETAVQSAIPQGANQIGSTAFIGTAAMATGQVSSITSSTQIAAARTGAPGIGRASITVVNTAATACYLGNTGVTTSTGILLPATIGASVTLYTTAAVFAACSSSNTLTYVENF